MVLSARSACGQAKTHSYKCHVCFPSDLYSSVSRISSAATLVRESQPKSSLYNQKIRLKRTKGNVHGRAEERVE